MPARRRLSSTSSSSHLMFMFSAAPLLFLAIASHARPEARENQHHFHTCHKIARDISSASQLFFPRARLVLFPANPIMLIIDPSCASVYFRHFAFCSIEYTRICLLGGARLGRGCEQDCKQNPLQCHRLLLNLPFFCAAKDPGIVPDAFCGEGWRTYYQPGILIYARRANHNVTLQRHESQF